MTRTLAFCVALAAIALTACDVRAFLLDTDALPGQREAAARACCRCVAENVALDPADQCVPPDDDAGVLGDGGGVNRSRCLCDALDGDECAQLLLSGGEVSVLSACVTPGGQCYATCDGVLAYP